MSQSRVSQVQQFAYYCRYSELNPTKDIFWIFDVLKLNSMTRLCDLFMEQPVYSHDCFPNLLLIQYASKLIVDGKIDVPVYAACRSNTFECMNGSCIPRHQRCDGVAHCSNGEDELNCIGEFLSTRTQTCLKRRTYRFHSVAIFVIFATGQECGFYFNNKRSQLSSDCV